MAAPSRPRVLVLRHGDDPPDDRVHTHLHLAGYAIETLRLHAGDTLPALDTIAGAVVHGGPFDADGEARHPFLRDEDRVIAHCLARELPLLGICQGAQQMARHLGARTGAMNGRVMEFGYYRVEPTDAGRDMLGEPLVVTQAHWHTFDIPAGAVHLARSILFENQAFSYGPRAVALQFHPEVTIEGFRRWEERVSAGTWTDLSGFTGVQDAGERRRAMLAHDEAQARWFRGLLAGLFAPLASRVARAA